ncbi:related to UBA domain-containing protein 7 [Cephalotrichum gorgonifer]|uniref:Related to UBA domain-containing protein 7 n=1 Tax=Cephalotrichum gorgonifer TaxID=2041049 RepID=A0AAE8MUB4_9PEZI|nr:related to UBA domain-containing protein 7 [Cephalotrichum gorgonifer]
MDDLAGLSWNTNTSNQGSKPNATPAPAFGSYPSLRPSPSPFASGRNTPLSTQGSGSSGPKPAAKPAHDSFSNLLNLGASKPAASLSLKEQQERLEAEKRRKEDERRKNAESQYGSGHFLDSLGSGGTSRTPSPAIAPLPSQFGGQNGKAKGDDDDLFAAFRADTKVDNASFYPPPSQSSKSTTPAPAPAPALDLGNPSAWAQPSSTAIEAFPDDDDPFGLGQLKPRSSATPPAPPPGGADQDDDFLGDLGRPVEEVRKKQQATKQPEPGKPIEDPDSDSDSDDAAVAPTTQRALEPFDKAVAQLVDYGFTPENARRGLTESGAGLNVQAAVNWLLDDAHRQANAKAKGKAKQPSPSAREASPAHRRGEEAWGRDESSGDSRRKDNRSPASGDVDLSKAAAAVSASFFKTANTLWKTGQKKVQKAVAEYQYEGDPNQPKWMRSAQQDSTYISEKPSNATEEALALDSGMRPDAGASQSTRRQPADSRDRSPAVPQSSRQSSAAPKWQQPRQQPLLDPRARLNRLAAEDDDLSSYVSPNRRRKGTPPASVPSEPRPTPPTEEPDLLFGGSSAPTPSLPHRPSQSAPPVAARRATPPAPKPTPRPSRQIPPITPAALQTSTRRRLEGTTHFKRGDYAAAHESYSSSLSALPSTHPLAIVLLTNRALTSLKTGEPKQAIEDANQAIALVGPSLGQGETVAVVSEGGKEEYRDMKDLYGKALSRKAEALEQMERWSDAASVWQQCIESNVGGASATAGRQRCQKALAPKPKATTPKPAAKPRPRPSAAADLGPQKSSEAVERLRAANVAAAKEDDEKFAISEAVDAKISAWRDGKRDNLRALLGSLDQVLWEGSGWKKAGMHELVMAKKVKIVYMKAIAKTHPDKLPQDASTEVRLIAALVFSTLNESWDKFKAENGL